MIKFNKTLQFIKDGDIHQFKTCKNLLTGSQMYWFDNGQAMYASDLLNVKRMIKRIKAQCVITSELNTCNHPLNIENKA